MERLTFEGDFCDIAQCAETRGGSFCESGACSQRKVWEQLKAYEDTDLTPERCAELAEAEKEGRLVVLPCKVGDTVYDISDGTAYPTRVLSFSYFGDKWACRTVSSYPDLEEFGKRIFLTREEAEKALKEARGE